MSFRLILAACALSVSAGAASAETTVYLGAGADYGYPHSGDEQAFGSLIAGATFDLWENMGMGIEAEVGEPLGSGDGRETSRVRGLFTYDFGAVTGIASLGVVQYELDQQNFDGETFGIGAQMGLMDRLDGRFEIMRDFTDNDYGTNVTTSRLALMFNF